MSVTETPGRGRALDREHSRRQDARSEEDARSAPLP